MRILFDQGTPFPLKRELPEHDVSTVYELGWSELKNGDLLNAAEGKFDVLITTDQSLRYQQNLIGRTVAILVLTTTRWLTIKAHAGKVTQAVDTILRGEFREIDFTT